MSLINVKDIRKVYRVDEEKIVALGRINLRIEQGEICCILGTSGSGKSTLLNIMAGLEKPTKGSVWIAGKNVTQFSEKQWALFRQRNIGFVFQSYNLMPTQTAIENVAMPTRCCWPPLICVGRCIIRLARPTALSICIASLVLVRLLTPLNINGIATFSIAVWVGIRLYD